MTPLPGDGRRPDPGFWTTRRLTAAVLLVALVLAGVVSLWAATSPDGLDRVAGDLGLARAQRPHPVDSPFAGYTSSFLAGDTAGRSFAGVVGVLLVLVLAGGLTLLLRRRER